MRHLHYKSYDFLIFLTYFKNVYVQKLVKSLYSKIMWGIPPISALSFHYGFSVYSALEKIPLRVVIIHIRLSGLELFTFLIDPLIEVKLRQYLPPGYSDLWLEVGGTQNAKDSQHLVAAAHTPEHHRYVNLAKDKVAEEVVTAQSWILS